MLAKIARHGNLSQKPFKHNTKKPFLIVRFQALPHAQSSQLALTLCWTYAPKQSIISPEKVHDTPLNLSIPIIH